MNYFKRFTNFCGGFVAFAATLHLIGEYMSFKLPEDAEMSKLKTFISAERPEEYRGYLIMIALFVLSVIAGRIFERLPYVTLAASLFPLYQAVNLFSRGKIEKFPSLYLILAILHTAGSIVHAISLDKRDGKRRGFVCANLLGAMIFAGGYWVWKRAEKLMLFEEPVTVENLGNVEVRLATAALDDVHGIILRIAVMIAVCTVISLILRDIYFIDAILAAVPLVYAINKVLIRGTLTVFGELTLVLLALYFITRVALVVFEPMRAERGADAAK